MTNRICGTCHYCCIHTPVTAFDKPAGIACEHLNVIQPSGCCGIYENRPDGCKQYTCSWLDGYLPDEMKPDASGILLEVGWIEYPRRLTILMGFENKRGAIDQFHEQLIAAAVNGVLIGIVPFDRGDVITFAQPDDAAAFSAWLNICREAGSVTHRFLDADVHQSLVE